VGIPLRYMHTPSEVIDLNDLEAVVQLLVSFARSLRKGEKFV
jgi:putative aminopeptidase FrvX